MNGSLFLDENCLLSQFKTGLSGTENVLWGVVLRSRFWGALWVGGLLLGCLF